MVEIGSSETIEALIAKSGKVWVDEAYLKIISEEANRKLEKNKYIIENFLRKLRINALQFLRYKHNMHKDFQAISHTQEASIAPDLPSSPGLTGLNIPKRLA